MTNLQRRIRKIEERLTDHSGLVLHSRKWLEYRDRQMYNFMKDPEHKWPAVLFPLDAMTLRECRRSTGPNHTIEIISGI